ncbi:TolC family outer membrane protein [Microbulbifer sp. SA54]|uniref:TolC family outer membrane protein n=1 Tax=Microbulbifer sp. SA54 TaxID=3401577 RepID=UPI003AAB6348
MRQYYADHKLGTAARNAASHSRLIIFVASALISPLIAQADSDTLETISPMELEGETSARPLFSAQPVSATASGETRQIDMSDAVQRAVAWHPVIGESVGALQQRQQNIRAARAGYFPQLSVGVVGGYDSEDDGDGDGHAVQLYVSQVIYDFGKVSSSVDTATAEARASQARVLQSIDTVARETAQAAIEVQRYQALLESAEQQIAGVSAISRLVKMRSDRGASSRSDFLQAQARMESARANKQQTQAQLERWRSVLQNLIGSADPVTVSMAVPEPVIHGCSVEPAQARFAPAVLIAEAERAAAVASLKEARASAWPTLSLDGSVNRYLDPDYVDSRALDDHESAIFFNLSMPIYQGGRISASKDAADSAMRSAEAAKDNARLSVERDLRIAQSQSTGLSRSLSILDTRLDAIAETRDLYRKQYSSLGTRTLVDLLNSEEEVHQARVEKNNTRYDLYRLQVDCMYTIGEIRRAFDLEGRAIQGVEVLP